MADSVLSVVVERIDICEAESEAMDATHGTGAARWLGGGVDMIGEGNTLSDSEFVVRRYSLSTRVISSSVGSGTPPQRASSLSGTTVVPPEGKCLDVIGTPGGVSSWKEREVIALLNRGKLFERESGLDMVPDGCNGDVCSRNAVLIHSLGGSVRGR